MTAIRTTSRTALLTGVPPIAAAAASAAIILDLDLPDRVAVHWGLDGVDRLAGVGDLIAPMVVIVAISTALMLAVVLLFSRRARSALFDRSVVAVSALIGFGVAFTSLGLALVQVGVTDATTVSVGTSLAASGIAFAAAAVIAVGLALLVPRNPVPPRVETDAAALPLGQTERASWTRSVAPSGVALGVLGLVALVVLVSSALAGVPVAVTIGILVLIGAVVGLLFWRVTVDARGIVVRSALGFPRFRVDAASVVAARAIDVSPLGQFGGYGIRVGAIGWGIIVRGGPAIEVERVGASPFIVTVDDAATAAALLTAVARRAHA
jgi:hypothetical protein